jgi:cytochrome c556
MTGVWIVEPAGAAQRAGRASAAPASRFRPVATVQELMATMIDPASKVVFEAVSTTETNGVEQKKSPNTDAEWAAVRTSALMLTESANLIAMDGRRIASPAKSNAAGPGELTPAQIEVRLTKERAAWNKLAGEFGAAAAVALKAADGKDADGVFASGEGIDSACENCHLRFWYPEQEKLFEKEPARPKP